MMFEGIVSLHLADKSQNCLYIDVSSDANIMQHICNVMLFWTVFLLSIAFKTLIIGLLEYSMPCLCVSWLFSASSSKSITGRKFRLCRTRQTFSNIYLCYYVQNSLRPESLGRSNSFRQLPHKSTISKIEIFYLMTKNLILQII